MSHTLLSLWRSPSGRGSLLLHDNAPWCTDPTLPWMLCENVASPNSVTHPATQILPKVFSGCSLTWKSTSGAAFPRRRQGGGGGDAVVWGVWGTDERVLQQGHPYAPGMLDPGKGTQRELCWRLRWNTVCPESVSCLGRELFERPVYPVHAQNWPRDLSWKVVMVP